MRPPLAVVFLAGGAAAGEHPAGAGEDGADEAAGACEDAESGEGGVKAASTEESESGRPPLDQTLAALLA